MQYALGLGLLLLSFFQNFSTVPWPAAHGEVFAFLAVLVWGWSAVRSPILEICCSLPTALLGLAILILLQYLCGQIYFGGDAVVMLLYVQLGLAGLVVGQLHAKDPNWPMALAVALLFAALGSALIALAQSLWVWIDSGWILPLAGYRRRGANFGQPNHLATLLVIGAASLIYLDQRLKISRPLLMLLSLLLLIGMGITESRTGLLSGVALLLWWFRCRKVIAPMGQWRWGLGGVLALGVLMWGWPNFIHFVHEVGLAASGAGLSTKLGTRMVVWLQLWEAVEMKPWFGWGIRGTSLALNAVLSQHVVSESFTYAHNIILDLAVGVGIPLTVLMLVFLGKWSLARLRSVHTPEAWYAVGLLIPFGIHCMFEYPFAYAHFLVPVMLAVGILEQGHTQYIGTTISRKVFIGYLIVFSGLLMWVAVEYVEAEEDFRVARFELQRVGVTSSDYEQPHIVLLTQLGALTEVFRWVPKPGLSPDQIELVRKVAMRFPWVANQNRYALCLALNGNPDEAARQLKVIRAMHGDKAYQAIKTNWQELARTQYPQLQAISLP